MAAKARNVVQAAVKQGWIATCKVYINAVGQIEAATVITSAAIDRPIAISDNERVITVIRETDRSGASGQPCPSYGGPPTRNR